jgi:glycosyltransferase involved in cell wall biosynthesis
MPRLAIIDQAVSAGGVERFLYGLVEGLMGLPETKEWEITILINRYNSANDEVKWPERLTGPNLRVDYLLDDRWNRFLNRLARPNLILGIPGTGLAQKGLSWFLNHGRLPAPRGYPDDAKRWIERYCAKRRFDLAYFAYPYSMECPEIATPTVATSHDFNWKHRRFSTIDEAGRNLANRLTPQWFGKSRRLVVSSEFIAAELRYFYPDFADKVRCVRLGIPGAGHVPTDAELAAYRRHHDLPEKFLLSTGWLAPHKNQAVLFEALAELRSRAVELPLVLVGPHSDMLRAGTTQQQTGYLGEIVGVTQKRGLSYGRDFWALGFVDDFELECLYRLATALVLPSLYEAGSFSLLEAVRARCPVICSAIPAHVEQAELLGHNLWTFDPHDCADLADAVDQVLAHPETAADRAAKAARMVDQSYSWPKAAAGYLSVFREALGESTMS